MLRSHVTGKISPENPAIAGIPAGRNGKTARELYLDYVNNFLTVTRFADHCGMTRAEALALIESERAKQ